MIKQNRTYKNSNCVKKRGGLYFKRDQNNKIVFLYEFCIENKILLDLLFIIRTFEVTSGSKRLALIDKHLQI